MIKYGENFLKQVGGNISARFDLDKTGSPIYETDSKGRRHYHIRLRLDSDNPELSNVTYKLHSSYYDPVRESDDREGGFAEELTSYGDYPVQVEAQVGSRLFTNRFMLSDLLEEGHGDALNDQAITDAIKTIKKY